MEVRFYTKINDEVFNQATHKMQTRFESEPLQRLSHELLGFFWGLEGFIKAWIGTTSGFSVLKRFLRF
jgi:hypothetical protein